MGLVYLTGIWLHTFNLAFSLSVLKRQDRRSAFIFDLSLDIGVVINIIVTFFRAKERFHSRNDGETAKVVRDCSVATSYLKGPFGLDLISSVPQLIFMFSQLAVSDNEIETSPAQTYLFYIFYWFKILRVIRLPTIIHETHRLQVKFFRRIFDLDLYKTEFETFKLFVITLLKLMFFLHVAACIWIYLGLGEDGDGWT